MRQLIAAVVTFAILSAIPSCSLDDVAPRSDGPNPHPSLLGVDPCEMEPTIERLTYGSKTILKPLPASGRLVEESHIKSKDECYSGKDCFPRTQSEGMAAHLTLHRFELARFGIDSSIVYDADWRTEWTPAEFGGTVGQGSIEQSPPISEETWIFNMQWASKDAPIPGTRYLATYGEHAVVVSAGWETGPEETKWLAGMQPAAFFVLGADDKSQIRVGRLRDQSLPLGPIQCL